MSSQARVTVFWPDSEWEEATEREYLVLCLRSIADEIEERGDRAPIEQQTIFINLIGRQYAAMLVSKL